MTSYREGLGLVVLCLAGGCWQEGDKIDGTFTEDEWAFLSTDLRLPEPQLCPSNFDPAKCDIAAELGQAFFFDPTLSGEITIEDPFAPGRKGEVGKVSCASCHDSQKVKIKDELGIEVERRRFFIDARSQPGNVSSGANFTKHNALSMVNVAYKSVLAEQNCLEPDADPFCANVYSWTGAYPTPGGVLALAAGKAAMNTNGALMAAAVRNGDGSRFMTYVATFGGFPPPCQPMETPCQTEAEVFRNFEIMFEAYVRRLNSINSPLDQYVAGEVDADGNLSTHDLLTDAERRGLAVFIGKAMCIDCHRGPLLSDLRFHNTGVPQIGKKVPAFDGGLGAEPVVNMPAGRVGEFLTPPLRHVSDTGPYMHSGQFATLAQVIEFYRAGGVAEGFSGIRDPRIQPLEITDDEARDLEAFLRRPLIGETISDVLATNPAVTP